MPEAGTALLNGTVLNDGGLACEYRFQYGRTPALGSNTSWSGGSQVTGDDFQQKITGLAANTIYYFRAQVRNSLATGSGDTLSFITTRANPAVGSLPATMISESQAILHGIVLQDSDRPGNVYFEWGGTKAYGNRTTVQNGFATGDEFNARITGLSEGTPIHYRAVFQSSPPVFGSDTTFTTASAVGLLTLAEADLLGQFMEESELA